MAGEREGLTEAERTAFRQEAIVPAGWKWCPDCNGEGFIVRMQADPDMTEHSTECRRCEAEQGIVPDA